ncbi:hypothetical protein HPP92_028637 [Vanilla planifolia]|uniref:Small ribosomal subunit protein bS18c n=1 Tax=Vanilla planifolia TaxID=51239 RepID=A0A835U289_VANPL|nr:hypothetical protein HPP92_028637 [Vanilla planifolia]
MKFPALLPILVDRMGNEITQLCDGNNNVNNKGNRLFENEDDFERRFFGDRGNSADTGSFFQSFDKSERGRGRSMRGLIDGNAGYSPSMNYEGFDTLSDGMDSKLKKAATSFPITDEIWDEDYKFRPDMTFWPATNYTLRDLDLTKPAIPKSSKRNQFETTTKEVLQKADFRNVRFLSNFLTEAGIIIKRSQTKISAKAQRRVAREIKTARAFGLMPFTTMGTKSFVFGRSMKDGDEFNSNNASGLSALNEP